MQGILLEEASNRGPQLKESPIKRKVTQAKMSWPQFGAGAGGLELRLGLIRVGLLRRPVSTLPSYMPTNLFEKNRRVELNP